MWAWRCIFSDLSERNFGCGVGFSLKQQEKLYCICLNGFQDSDARIEYKWKGNLLLETLVGIWNLDLAKECHFCILLWHPVLFDLF